MLGKSSELVIPLKVGQADLSLCPLFTVEKFLTERIVVAD